MKIIVAEDFSLVNDTRTFSYSQFKKGDIYEVLGINNTTNLYKENVVVLLSITENKHVEIETHTFNDLHICKKFFIFDTNPLLKRDVRK